jgi:hypothetical protein
MDMGFGTLNIWIRDEDCSLRNAWMADLEIKTCLGENLIDMLPSPDLDKIVDSLKEMYPSTNVSFGSAYGTKTIKIFEPQIKRIINHIPVDVPPGCYIVRVHVCGGGNEWSDRTMAVVGCDCGSCVNLIIKEAETCVKEVLIPLMRIAEVARIPREQVQVAVNVLRKAGEIPINEVANNLNERVELLREVKVAEANKIVNQAESGLKMVKEIQLKKKRRP